MELRDISKIKLKSRYGGFKKGTIGTVFFDGESYLVEIQENIKTQEWLVNAIKHKVAKPYMRVKNYETLRVLSQVCEQESCTD